MKDKIKDTLELIFILVLFVAVILLIALIVKTGIENDQLIKIALEAAGGR